MKVKKKDKSVTQPAGVKMYVNLSNARPGIRDLI